MLHWQVLFNDTIFHNIHYGRLSATKEEVCDRLVLRTVDSTLLFSWPNGYSV